jgi:hypothetical protein
MEVEPWISLGEPWWSTPPPSDKPFTPAASRWGAEERLCIQRRCGRGHPDLGQPARGRHTGGAGVMALGGCLVAESGGRPLETVAGHLIQRQVDGNREPR